MVMIDRALLQTRPFFE